MKAVIINELGLGIVKENVSTEGDGVCHFDIRVDPEVFRKIEEAVQEHTQGNVNMHIAISPMSTNYLCNNCNSYERIIFVFIFIFI